MVASGPFLYSRAVQTNHARLRPERRRDTRLVIALPAIIDNAVGETRNVSTSGVYVSFPHHTSLELLPGSTIRLEIMLEHATADGPFSVTCQGEIVRVDRSEDRVGVAARITGYSFGTAKPARDALAQKDRQ